MTSQLPAPAAMPSMATDMLSPTITCMYVSVWICVHEYKCPRRPEEVGVSSRAGIIEGGEPHCVNARNQTPVFHKSSVCLLTNEPFSNTQVKKLKRELQV